MNTAIEPNTPTQRELVEDTYFLNPDDAYRVASMNNRIRLADGTEAQQLCYFNGEYIESDLLNLINVPFANLISFFSETSLRLPSHFHYNRQQVPEDAGEEIAESVFDALNSVKEYRDELGKELFRDSYFFNRNVAYQTALQQNRVKLNHPVIDGLQICYHDGTAFENAPDNLISVPVDKVMQYFIQTDLRMPRLCVTDPSISAHEQKQIEQGFTQLIKAALTQREAETQKLNMECKAQSPGLPDLQNLRISLPTSRMTLVMQYATKNLAAAFQKLGHDARVVMEENDMQFNDGRLELEQRQTFNPNVIININHNHNRFLNEDVFNFTWWQDKMPGIAKGQSMHWRKRDIVLSAYPEFDPLLEQTGAAKVIRQHLCVNTSEFHIKPEIKRENKIVFIGSSYEKHIANASPITKKVVDELEQLLVNGDTLGPDSIEMLADKYHVRFEDIWYSTMVYVVRNKTLYWLCNIPGINLEVYGHFWENNPIVKPYYKGVLEHGEAVANVYNSAKYAMVSMPHGIHTQRLAEVAACGCIPVVYDCRSISEKPHWDDECLFFRTYGQLQQCLTQEPSGDLDKIADFYTYEKMAEHIVDMIRDHLEQKSV